jgi:hypothetical protein
MSTELTPPTTLTPPEPVQPVPQEQAGQMVKLNQPTVQKLDEKVNEFIDLVVRSEVQSDPFKERVNAIHNLGNKEIRASASVSNRILDRPVKAMEGGLFNDTTPISRSLIDLRKTVEDLDPRARATCSRPNACWGSCPSATSCAITSCATSPRRATSTPSSTPCTAARTSCARTTPASNRKRSTCGS